jgi:hypothetical protein
MDKVEIIAKVREIEQRREYLVALLSTKNIGLLRTDIEQTLEELDDLIADFKSTFPANS